MGFQTTSLFGYRVSCGGIRHDVARALDFVKRRTGPAYMACANPHSLVMAVKDPLFREALLNAGILVPDGAGIVLAAKILNKPIHERVAGFEFFRTLSDHATKNGGARYFFLGSSSNVLDLIAARLQREYPGITVCGTYSPPFADDFSAAENERMVAAINEAAPDVLWVGMTAPKQEKWIYRNRDKLAVPFIAAVGAVFDFYAGTKKRSSRFWQRLGLEWLPRFLNEPKRLWERNLKSTPIFLGWIVKEKVRQLTKCAIRTRGRSAV
ncbi:MAG TPA: WecB/TagA/CpsF family glycosyltransferase [Geobacteraceae bacterium]|nr:WecB/TagA/CpsF family glycosyltransferase [Geobacteraceae bacterium]